MAEIVRTETRTQKRHVTSTRSEELVDATQVHTVVRSRHGGNADMVRDFVAALNAADAPDSAHVGATARGDLLVGLTAEWTRHLDDET